MIDLMKVWVGDAVVGTILMLICLACLALWYMAYWVVNEEFVKWRKKRYDAIQM